MKYCRSLIFTGDYYNDWILWYVLAYIYALIVLYIEYNFNLNKINRTMVTFFITCAGMLIDWLITSQIVASDNIFKTIAFYSFGSGRLFSGLVYIQIGMIIFNEKMKMKDGIFITALSILFIYVGIAKDIMPIVVVMGLFIISTQLSIVVSINFCILRKMSRVMYFSHLWIWTILYKAIYGEKTEGLQIFLFTVIASIVISLSVMKVEKICMMIVKKSNLFRFK